MKTWLDLYHRNSGESIRKEKIGGSKDGQLNESKENATGQLWKIEREIQWQKIGENGHPKDAGKWNIPLDDIKVPLKSHSSTCMEIYMYTHKRTQKHIHICIYTHIYRCVCISISLYIYLNKRVTIADIMISFLNARDNVNFKLLFCVCQ